MATHMAARLISATALLLFVATQGVAAAATVRRTKNGIRIVGTSALKGRVEVLTDNGYFVPQGKKQDYVPLCDTSFSDNDAQIMCEMLGLNFGRKYYEPGLTYVANSTPNAGGMLMCSAVSGHRRLLTLAESSLTATAGANRDAASSVSNAVSGSSSSVDVTTEEERRSLSMLLVRILSPASAPYSCQFSAGSCDPTGPLAGIECSAKAFPPAPSPPPSPPNPPPAPPPTSNSIKFIGRATTPNTEAVEPNLCPGDPDFCETGASRVELEVKSGSKLVFAPICAINDTSLLDKVAYIACQQAFDWPSKERVPAVYVYRRLVAKTFFEIPKGTATKPGDFDPAKVPAWVTVAGFKKGVTDPRRLQDMNIKVSKSRCASGRILAMACYVAMT